MKKRLGLTLGTLAISYLLGSMLLPIAIWRAGEISFAVLPLGVFSIYLFMAILVILWLFPDCRDWVTTDREWLLTHKTLTDVDRRVFPLAFLVLFFFLVTSTKSPRPSDVLTLAFWSEASWLLFIWSSQNARNLLGMGYRRYSYASVRGAKAFTQLSMSCFNTNKENAGVAYLLTSLEMIRAHMYSRKLRLEELDQSIVTMTLLNEYVSNGQWKRLAGPLNCLSLDLHSRNGLELIEYLPSVKSSMDKLGLEWTGHFRTIEKRIPLSTTIAILVASVSAISSLMSDKIRDGFFEYLRDTSSQELILSAVLLLVFPVVVYTYLADYLNKAPIRWTDLVNVNRLPMLIRKLHASIKSKFCKKRDTSGVSS